MDNEYLLNFLKEKNVATIKKKKHTYLTYYGLEQQDTYVLKDGVVKTRSFYQMVVNSTFLTSIPQTYYLY